MDFIDDVDLDDDFSGHVQGAVNHPSLKPTYLITSTTFMTFRTVRKEAGLRFVFINQILLHSAHFKHVREHE